MCEVAQAGHTTCVLSSILHVVLAQGKAGNSIAHLGGLRVFFGGPFGGEGQFGGFFGQYVFQAAPIATAVQCARGAKTPQDLC